MNMMSKLLSTSLKMDKLHVSWFIYYGFMMLPKELNVNTRWSTFAFYFNSKYAFTSQCQILNAKQININLSTLAFCFSSNYAFTSKFSFSF